MAGTDKRTTTRAPVVLRIKLRYPDLDTFVDRFATNIGTGGMFIASRRPKTPGTSLKFSLMLADESRVVAGTGVVRWVRDYNPDKPRRPHGMGIEFVELDDGSQDVIDRVVAYRASQGLETDEIPLADKSAVVRAAAEEVSAPMAVETGPVPVFRDRAPTPSIPGPRPSSDADAGLDALLDSAVDLQGAVQRARALVGGGMEAELARLLENLPHGPAVADMADVRAEPKARAKPEAEPERAPAPEAAHAREAEPVAAVEAETKPAPVAAVEAEAVAAIEPKAELAPVAAVEAGAIAAIEPKAELAPETDAAAVPETGIDVDLPMAGAGTAELLAGDRADDEDSTDVGRSFPVDVAPDVDVALDDNFGDEFDDIPTQAGGQLFPDMLGEQNDRDGDIGNALASLGDGDDPGTVAAVPDGESTAMAFDIDTSDLTAEHLEVDPADFEDIEAPPAAKRGLLNRVFGSGDND